MKYALGVEYRGTGYCGWQRQPHCDSVQQNLEQALGFVADHSCRTGVRRAHRHWCTRAGAGCSFRKRGRVAVNAPGCWAPIAACRAIFAFAGYCRLRMTFTPALARAQVTYRYVIYNETVPSALFHDLERLGVSPAGSRQNAPVCAHCCSVSMISAVSARLAVRRSRRVAMCNRFRYRARVGWLCWTSRPMHSCITWCVILPAA